MTEQEINEQYERRLSDRWEDLCEEETEELNDIVANIEALAAILPLEADNIANNAITTAKLASTAVTTAKINFNGFSVVGNVSGLDNFSATPAWSDKTIKTVNVTLPAAGTYKFIAHSPHIGTDGVGEGEFKIKVSGNTVGTYGANSLSGGDWMTTITASGTLSITLSFVYNGVAVSNGRWGTTDYCFTRIG